MNELVDQTRLAHSGFADDRQHLSMAVGRQLQRAIELLQLSVAADEPREAPANACLKTGPRRACPRHLVDLH